ncbi:MULTISPECIES: hypothetical protein [Sphingobacterium]|uniref:Cytochrome B n=1 Tax=Sphingobacterium hotanense TaxID=649196 RepID=A0ABT7NNL9_9SPHI|nr:MULTISPECIES: hypothetical protein [Sphingobacterium]MDM1048739.1 hypothetical protein [Sphingobacterium hotanense]
MYIILKNLHSYLAIILLLVVIAAAIYSIYGWTKDKNFSDTSKKILLAGLIAAHLQLVIGFVIYFISPLGISNFSKEVMGNSIGRLYALEHPLMMLVGIILITIGYSKSKRAKNETTKFRLAGIFYTIGLLLILSRIPWHVWI